MSTVQSDSEDDSPHVHGLNRIQVSFIPNSKRLTPVTSTDSPACPDQLKVVLQQMFLGHQHSQTGMAPYSGKPASSAATRPQDIVAGKGPSPAYLKAAAVPSIDLTAPQDPRSKTFTRESTKSPRMVFISLDDVIDAPLPEHFEGAYTECVARGYLETLMDYLLRPKAGWIIAFFTKLPREVGLKRLEELNLPIGNFERDVRDGVVGLFSLSDMRRSRPGGPREIKDLEVLWDIILKEEGVQGGPDNTVVIAGDQTELRNQPYNLVAVPKYNYLTPVPASHDQALFMMIAVLKDLETESNFAYHIKEMGWSDPMHFQDWKNPVGYVQRAMLTQMAVRICAFERLAIKAYAGNKYK